MDYKDEIFTFLIYVYKECDVNVVINKGRMMMIENKKLFSIKIIKSHLIPEEGIVIMVH